MKKRAIASILFFFSPALFGETAAPAEEAFLWGRDQEGRRTFTANFAAGKIISMEGTVKETIRPYYELIGQEAQGEDYDLKDLGLDQKVGVFGLELEQEWKYVTLGLRGFYFQEDTKNIADQNYYIGLADTITYQGQEYQYMKIPKGDQYLADINAYTCELRALITPCSVRPSESFQIVPWVYLGIMSIFGKYHLDDGPPRGTEVYEEPAYDYVIGGSSSGWTGIAVPAFGGGGEITLGNPEEIRLVLRGNYSLFFFNGSTKYIPINIRKEKDLDLDYYNYELRAWLEIPLSPKADLLLGASYMHLSAQASITAQEATPEEIEAEREKFDKEADITMSMGTVFAGLKF
jgi:hypothetical protein